jgi:hypothetical protein
MFTVIQVATDGSPAGDLALEFGKDLVVDRKARMIVVYVDELVPGHGGAHTPRRSSRRSRPASPIRSRS